MKKKVESKDLTINITSRLDDIFVSSRIVATKNINSLNNFRKVLSVGDGIAPIYGLWDVRESI